MRLMGLISWVLIFIGLCFKMLHWPFSDILFLLGALIMVIHGVTFFIKNSKKRLVDSLFQIALSSWLISIVFCIFYWSQGPRLFGRLSIILLIPILLSVLFIAFHLIKEASFSRTFLFRFAFIAFGFWFCTMPAHRMYYFFNLTETFHGESRKSNFICWDKYSWFLNTAGRKEEANQANIEAQKSLIFFRDAYHVRGRNSAQKILLNHQEMLRNDNWRNFERMSYKSIQLMDQKLTDRYNQSVSDPLSLTEDAISFIGLWKIDSVYKNAQPIQFKSNESSLYVNWEIERKSFIRKVEKATVGLRSQPYGRFQIKNNTFYHYPIDELGTVEYTFEVKDSSLILRNKDTDGFTYFFTKTEEEWNEIIRGPKPTK